MTEISLPVLNAGETTREVSSFLPCPNDLKTGALRAASVLSADKVASPDFDKSLINGVFRFVPHATDKQVKLRLKDSETGKQFNAFIPVPTSEKKVSNVGFIAVPDSKKIVVEML